jgi:Sulfotransferase domain
VTEATGRLPNFFIIGAMRSGTSSLTGYLRPHPDVFIGHKEPHFFDQRYDKGLDWYKREFAEADGARAVGEATQTYMYDEHVPALMADCVPDAKLIAILRHPVDRAYSHYWLNRAREKESLSFEDALRSESDRLASGDSRDRFTYSYVDRGRYHGQLEHVLAYYPREALHVLLFEDLRDRPEEAYRNVCTFLGIDDAFLPPNLGVQVNPHMNYRSVRVRQVGKKLPYPLNRMVRRLNSKPATYPRMRPETRTRLIEEFDADNRKLADWLERDLSSWSR